MVNEKRGADTPDFTGPQAYLTAAQAGLSVEQRIALARKPWRAAVSEGAIDVDALAHKLVLQLLVRDAEVRVRQALAETLAENPAAPHDIIFALATDVDLVASPTLSLSEILTSDELIRIIEHFGSSLKMAAIANRKEVGSAVCLALIEKGDEDTAARLLQNSGAEISEAGIHLIIDRHGEQERIQIGLVDRKMLPATAIERVVAMISSELLNRLVKRHPIPTKAAASVVLETRDRATLGLTAGLSEEATGDLVTQLMDEQRLTQSLLLRSICTGNLDFVIHAIAARCMVSPSYVRERITEAIPKQLDELWGRADLPAKLLPVTKAALEVLLKTNIDGAKWDVDHFRRRITQRMITRSDELAIVFSDEDIEYLIAASGGADAKLLDFAPDA